MVISKMESNMSPATTCTLHSQFMGHVQAHTVSESKAVKAWNSGLLSAPSDLSIGVSCLYPENGACAAVLGADLQSGFADEEISTLLRFGPAPPFRGFKQGYENALISKSITCLNGTVAFDFPCDCLYSHRKVGLDCKDAALHTFLRPSTQPDRLDVNVTELCQKRFAIVDHTESKRKKCLQCSSNSQRDYLEHLQIKTGMAIDKCKKETIVELSRGNVTAGESTWLRPRRDDNKIKEESELSCPRKNVRSGVGICPQNKCERLHSVIFLGGEVPFPCSYPPTGAEAFGRGSGNEGNLDFLSLSHEDTDDLEALLSSDDELSSTGHSPNDDLTKNSRDGGSLNSGKKRNREVIDYCSDHDAESSTATSAFRQLGYLKDRCTNTFHTVSDSMESATSKQCRDTGSSDELAAFSVRCPGEIRSRNETTKHRGVYKRPSSEKQRPAKRARKKKIRRTFQLLRDIIPGGECMDTAFVLDGAIQYVKSLQVKVKRMEAKKLI